MGFWSNLFTQKNVDGSSSGVGIARQTAPPGRGTAQLLNAYNTSPWLHSVTKKIAEHMAAVPWQLFVVRRGGGKAIRAASIQAAPGEYQSKMLARHKAAGELEEILDHPMLEFINAGNPQLTGLQSRLVTSLHLDLRGESFWLLTLNGLGKPLQYWPLPSNWVNELPTDADPFYKITLNGQRLRVPEDLILWQKYPNPANPYGRGSGTGGALADDIDTEEYASKMVKAGFYNRNVPDMLIGLEGIESQDQLDRVKRKFSDTHRGPERNGVPHFHTGKVSVEQLQQSFKDMQVLELRSWERDAFGSVFGVPPEILGLMGSSNRATAFEARRIFAREVLVPRLDMQKAALQRLAPRWDERLIVAYESPEPDDRAFRLEAAKAQTAALTRGEWRVLAGHEHRGEIDDIHIEPAAAGRQSGASADESNADDSKSLDPDPAGPHAKSNQYTKAFIKGVTEATLEALRPARIQHRLDPLWLKEVDKWGTAEAAAIGSSVSFDILNPLVQDHLLDFSSTKITRINNTTRELVRGSLVEGLQAGEGARDIAKRVRGVMIDRSKSDALRIARTESNRSSNFATHDAHVKSGIVQRRQWVPTFDARVRDTHLDLGDPIHIVNIQEPFSIAGFSAMYPGDFGVAEMDINCRCTTAAIIDRPKDAAGLEKAWKAHIARIDSWEADAVDALQKAFADQAQDLADAIDRLMGAA